MDYVEPLFNRDLRILRGPGDFQENSGLTFEGVSTSSLDATTFKVIVPGRGFKFADPTKRHTIDVGSWVNKAFLHPIMCSQKKFFKAMRSYAWCARVD